MLRTQLGQKYRRVGRQVALDLAATGGPQPKPDDVLTRQLRQCVDAYRQGITPIAGKFKLLVSSGELTCSLDSLLGSLLHMLNNRVFKANSREHELVVYDLLRRHYLASAKRLPSSDEAAA